MQLLSTLALLAIAAQCVLASPERKLLRSGYDAPIDFSTITGGGDAATSTAQQQQNDHGTDAALPALPGVDSLTKSLSGVTGGEGGLSKLLPSGLPSTDALSSITKGGGLLPTDALSSVTKGGSGVSKLVPTDLGALTKGGALSSLTGGSGLSSITSGLTKGGKLPLLPGSGSKSASLTNGLSGITDGLSGITGGLGLPSTSAGNNGKQAYASETTGDKSPDQKPGETHALEPAEVATEPAESPPGPPTDPPIPERPFMPPPVPPAVVLVESAMTPPSAVSVPAAVIVCA
ncbi:hypothetical protein PHYPSEUDO_000728 [Phytophthora pseudosyringae]|uniref:Uncharacterized protein n=1 Tax=Phytophthora pseudosyringae TaxID=221518 RepID=A0A8T1V2M4_9STRA|nr:hypothetical protein PHYPSEUDO_000728 [Phytophthora pseudosyringae]